MTNKQKGRYTVPANEDWQPGSNSEVLKNYLDIISPEKMQLLEAAELKRTELALPDIYPIDYQFTVNDICNIHELWLGDIYAFAGKFRTVNMQKEEFLFAPASNIDRLMQAFEEKHLKKYTPCCHIKTNEELAQALAEVHIEFIIIHPFREGNGRVGRLFADLMILQARKQTLNFSLIDHMQSEKGFERYIKAIHAGHCGDAEPMIDIFMEMLKEEQDN